MIIKNIFSKLLGLNSKKFEKIGLIVPKILLPNSNVDMTKWAVIACDQYTSEPQYWEKVKEFVRDNPSTLNLIYPEAFLEAPDKEERIKKINEAMHDYLIRNLFTEFEGFILVDRKTPHTPSRKGLIVALDLEKYDFNKGSQTLIRATEGTIIERLPPRIKIRENAELELPHIMVLIDDPEKTVIEPLFKEKLQVLYDFDLMFNSGHIKGYAVKEERLIKQVAKNLERLADPEIFNQKYGVSNKNVLLYAVGDGNHSLATAKSVWENLKAKGARMDHPARYALVELINVHDEGLEFKPIHRILFKIDKEKILKQMEEFYKEQGSEFSYGLIKNKEDFEKALKQIEDTKDHKIAFVTGKTKGIITIKKPKLNLAVGTLQAFLDKFIQKSQIDYIHGEETVIKMGSKEDNMGFILPAMSKHDLFKTVILDGVLPRKTFSMGEADEKRFYLEARKIR